MRERPGASPVVTEVNIENEPMKRNAETSINIRLVSLSWKSVGRAANTSMNNALTIDTASTRQAGITAQKS
jgi:hypothetical protein